MRPTIIFCTLILSITSCTKHNIDNYQSFSLSDLHYEIIEGDFSKLPEFSDSTVSSKGFCDSIDLNFIKLENYAIRFNGNLIISEKGKFKFTASGGTKGTLNINNETLFDFGWKMGSSTLELKEGEYEFDLLYIKNTKAKKHLQLEIAPDNLLISEDLLDKRHWLFFGWEEDHPKAISLMGGTLYPRRPKLLPKII